MSLKSLNFINPRGGRAKATENQDQNWQTLIDNFKTLSLDLVLLSPVGTASIHTGKGTFTILGPLVYFTFLINVPNGSGWQGISSVPMPFVEAFTPTSTSIGTYGLGAYAFPVSHATLGTVPAHAFLDTPPIVGVPFRTSLKFNTPYTNTSGFTQVFGVSGLYYRS